MIFPDRKEYVNQIWLKFPLAFVRRTCVLINIATPNFIYKAIMRQFTCRKQMDPTPSYIHPICLRRSSAVSLKPRLSSLRLASHSASRYLTPALSSGTLCNHRRGKSVQLCGPTSVWVREIALLQPRVCAFLPLRSLDIFLLTSLISTWEYFTASSSLWRSIRFGVVPFLFRGSTIHLRLCFLAPRA